MPLRVVIAPSCFKESLSAEESAIAMEEGVRRAAPEASITRIPIVDGGEGFALALVRQTGGELHEVEAKGPLGGKRRASFGLLGRTTGDRSGEVSAVVEAASAVGLRLLPRRARDPLKVSSEGVGMLIRAALDAGATSITVGCGDTANNDGGFGLARALGARFLDASGDELPRRVEALRGLARIDLSDVDPRVASSRLEVACNPVSLLSGSHGTSRIFAPYKGATPEAVEILDAAMARLASVIESQLGVRVSDTPGGGTGGGMGAALHGLFGASLRPRYDIVLSHLPLDASLDEADLVLTGEGSIDETTLLGKVPTEVARRAAQRGIPVIALVGSMGPGAERNLEHGIAAIVPIGRKRRAIEAALRHARADLARASYHTIRLVASAERRALTGSA